MLSSSEADEQSYKDDNSLQSFRWKKQLKVKRKPSKNSLSAQQREKTLNGYTARELIDEIKRQVSERQESGTKIQVPGIGYNRCTLG